MIILDYNKSRHKQVIAACVRALRAGKIVVYPTDTSYGLAADSGNAKAVRQLYRIKGRNFNKPVHLVIPSIGYAKKIVSWNRTAQDLAKKFWSGALTLVVRIKKQEARKKERLALGLKKLSAGTGFLGLRMPKNQTALDLAKFLKRPITATSANRSGQSDTYALADILRQFGKLAYKPDIIINAGRLAKRKPSTVARIRGFGVEILRPGPVSAKQIREAIGSKL